MSMYDDPNPNSSQRRQPPAKVKASPEQEALLKAQLARLKRDEESDTVYQEMLQAVQEKRLGQ